MLSTTLPRTPINELFKNLHVLHSATLDDGRPVPVMLYGPPGISKTQQIYNTMVPKVAAMAERPVKVLHENLASMEPTDLRGIPFPVKPNDDDREKNRRAASVWTRPDIQAKIERITDEDPDTVIILLFDEYGQASPDVKKAAIPVFAEGVLGDYKLPSNVWVWGTSNFQDNNAGVTKTFAHELSRMYHYNCYLPVESWVTDYAIPKHLPPAAVMFAERNASIFEGTDEQYKPAPDSPRCNYRSFTYAMKALNSIKQAQGDTDPRTIPTDSFTKQTLSGLIGVEIAEKFLAIANDLHKLPDPKAIYKDWQNTPIPEGRDRYLQFPLQAMLISMITSAEDGSDEQTNALNYATRLSPTLASGIFAACSGARNSKKVQEFAAQHTSLFTSLAEAKR